MPMGDEARVHCIFVADSPCCMQAAVCKLCAVCTNTHYEAQVQHLGADGCGDLDGDVIADGGDLLEQHRGPETKRAPDAV